MKALAEGDLLTIPQVQRLVPVGRSTIYKLVESGELRSYRIRGAGSRRGRILVARRDLEAFVDGARQTATRAPVWPDVDDLLRKVRRA